MNAEELKSMLEGQKADIVNMTEKAERLQTELEAKNNEINNLDASVKEQQKAIDALTAQVKDSKPRNVKTAFAEAFAEKAEEIKNFVKSSADKASMSFEVKLDSNITNGAQFVGIAEPGVSSTPNLPNAFLANLPIENCPGTNVAWLEGAYTSNAAYVDELAAVATDDSASVTEKHRSFGKLAAHILISSEVNDFLGQVYNWATGEAIAKIEKKADAEIIGGAGADGTQPRKVYGLKGQATAFSALGKYTSPNVADVIKDAVLQAQKGGFTANVAFVAYDALPAIQGLKDSTGNYLYNQMTGYLGQVKIVPSANLTAKQILVADSSVCLIKRRPGFEFEVVRNGAKDGFDVYVRRAYQALIKAGDKGGAIWVADYSTAITAITPSA